VGSLTVWHWILILAVVLGGFLMADRVHAGLRAMLPGWLDGGLSWRAISVLFIIAVVALAASALFNGTWAG